MELHAYFHHALSTLSHGALHVTLAMLMTSVTGSSPAPTGGASSKGQPSHLLFYLSVEKELIPQTADLAARARHFLDEQCDKISECFSEAERLPPIQTLSDFPSESALRREGSKMFTKHLLKESYINLYKLEKLLEMEQAGSQFLQDLVAGMSRTRQQFKEELESYFKVSMSGRNFHSLSKSKSRYLRSRPGVTDREYRLRLIYTTYTRLLKISHILGYTVKLSWVALDNKEWFLTS